MTMNRSMTGYLAGKKLLQASILKKKKKKLSCSKPIKLFFIICKTNILQVNEKKEKLKYLLKAEIVAHIYNKNADCQKTKTE